MKKVVNLLERHVQWLAMALGFLFLGYAVYAFVWTPDPVVTMKSPTRPPEMLTPGKLDLWMDAPDNVPEELAPKINATGATTPAMPDLVSQFNSDVQTSNTSWHNGNWNVAKFGAISGGSKAPVGPIVQVIGLPDVPTPDGTKLDFYRSSIADPANATGLVDKIAIKASGSFDVAQLAANYRAMNINMAGNGACNNALIARIVLIREERDSNDNWGNDRVIGELPINAIPVMPPLAPAPNKDEYDYRLFAKDHQPMIVQPAYYVVKAGDDPSKPPAPPTTIPTDPNAMTVDPKQAELDAAKKAAQEKLNHPPNPATQRPPRPSGHPSAGPGGSGSRSSFYPLELAQAAPPDRPPGGAYVPQPGQPSAPPMPGDGSAPALNPDGTPAATQPVQIPVNLVNAPWLPQANSAKLNFWAYDDTIEPGKTYRYCLKVVLVNPVFSQTVLVKNPNFANVLLLESKPSAWSDPITIPTPTRFFVTAGTPAGANMKGIAQASVIVFRWTRGQWNRKDYNALDVGQPVGELDPASNLDFSTGYLLVDVRPAVGSQQARVVLTDVNGQISVHDPSVEKNADELKLLNYEVNNPTGKTAGAPSSPTGFYPPGASGGSPPGGNAE